MATGVSGYLPSYYQTNPYITKYGGMYIQPHYVEEWYAEGNYSIIKIDHINFQSSMYSQSVGWSLSGKISINGKEYSYGGSLTTGGYTATSWPCSIVSDPIYHNTDGSKAITISLTYAYTASGQVGAVWENSGTLSTASVTLTTIPLASTIVATDANVGSVSQITVTRKSTNYTHSIYYHFGNLTGYITSSGDISDAEVTFSNTSIGWTIPTSFYTQIPNDKTGYGSLHIKTYSGSTQIGDTKTTTFTVTAAEALCSPTVSGTVVDVNEATIALTGSADILVRYMSDALCTISTEAKNSATVSSKTIAGVTVTENTRTIVGIETDTVAFGVTDSRGYSNSADVTKYFVPYIKLTNNSTAVRPDPTSGKVTLRIEGSCFNGNFGVVDNIVNATYSVNSGNPVDATVVMSGNAYSITLNLTGFDYQSSHSIEVVVTDKLMTVSRTLPIQKGIPVFDWGEDDFRFNVEVDFADRGQTIRNLMTWDTPNGDFNDCVQPGFYWMQLPYCTNAPMSDGYGFLEVIQTHKQYDSGVMQRFTEYYSHQVFVRSYINGGWNSWTNPAYPVGAVYISTDSTSPAQLFGGTWTQIAADRVLMGTTSSSKINTTVEAGLPNITGWFTTRWTDASGGGIIFPAENCQGAFYAGWNGNNYFTGNNNTSGSGGNHYNTANFNAGFSNAIYGRSSTVQPPALYVYMWKRTA